MALIKCPECNKEISDSVKLCPNCGFKIRKTKMNRNKISKKTMMIIIAACLVLSGVLIGLYCVFGLSDSEKAQVIALNNQITEKMQLDIENKNEQELTKYKQEYQDIVEQYSNLQWKQQRKVKDYKSIENRISDIDDKIAHIAQEEVQNVINLINDIGEVTLNSKSAIDNIKSEYGKLDDSQKAKVTNYNQVSGFETKYDELCLQDAINSINHIGKVSLENESKSKIDSAENAYNKLSFEAKKKVTNYNILKKKKSQYNKLNKQKNLLLNAKSQIKDGRLNAAKKTLNKLSSKFKYKGTKVSTLKKRLASKGQWVALCGRWKTTSGQMRVSQVWDYDGRSESWYRDFERGEESIEIHCQLKDNGKVKVKISGSIPIYTSYSSISEGVEEGTVDLDTTRTMSRMGAIKINKYTTLTLSSSGITVNYYKVNPNESQYFTYKYKTTMSLRKKTKSF